MSSTIGKIFKVSVWGESHGEMIGAVIDGCPSLLKISPKEIQKDLDRRKPGQNKLVTKRNESDRVEIVSGVIDNKTTGAPITLLIKNKNKKTKDYTALKDKFRPGHADITHQLKFGIRDFRGGGWSSGRLTAPIVATGSIAKKIISTNGIQINAFTKQIGKISCDPKSSNGEKSIVRCPDVKATKLMIKEIENAMAQGDSVGGVVECRVSNTPLGLGEPLYDNIDSDLAKAMMSINGAKGFEMGLGFGSATMMGSENNDEIISLSGRTKTNNAGGVLGGVTNGMDLVFRVAFKPTSSIAKIQNTVDMNGKKTIIQTKGRHDSCYVPRAVVVVEAMCAIILCDHLLRSNLLK